MTDTPISIAQAKYDGRGGRLFKLALWTTFLTVITLGIYRFWAKTRIRQYIWSSASVDEDGFEYTGTGLEKFLGFLVAIVFLAVYLGIIQMLLFFVGLNVFVEPQTQSQVAAQVFAIYITFFALVPFIFFAQYRARRYQFARTRWRGIRFGVDAAAWGYVIRAIGHTSLTVVTLGVLLPRQTFYLEKYVTDRTHFGDARLSQHGKWTALYPAMKHLAIGLAILILSLSIGAYAELPALIGIGIFVGYIWILIGMVSYRVRSFGYLTRNKILGDHVGFDAKPSTSDVILTYVVGALVVGATVGGLFLIAGLLVFAWVQGVDANSMPSLGIAQFVPLVLYLSALIISGPVTLVFITQPVLAIFIRSVAVMNTDALAQINQRATDTGADAEGFADALDIGGGI